MTEGVIDLFSWMTGGVTGTSDETQPYTPLAFPLDLPPAGITDIKWNFDTVHGISESPFTFHRKKFIHSGERLRATVVLSQMPRAQAADCWAFLLNLAGEAGTFMFGDVFLRYPRGLALGSPVVSGADQAGRILETDGWDANVVGILKNGDTIQIGNRLYFVTQDSNSQSDGTATLRLFPRIRIDDSPADGTLIRTVDARGTFELADASGGLYASGLTGMIGLPSFQIIEAL